MSTPKKPEHFKIRHKTHGIGKAFNSGTTNAERKVEAPKSSWWTKACQPNQREKFMAAAHERIDERRHEKTALYAEQGDVMRHRSGQA